jgi:hypothetical protein
MTPSASVSPLAGHWKQRDDANKTGLAGFILELTRITGALNLDYRGLRGNTASSAYVPTPRWKVIECCTITRGPRHIGMQINQIND